MVICNNADLPKAALIEKFLSRSFARLGGPQPEA